MGTNKTRKWVISIGSSIILSVTGSYVYDGIKKVPKFSTLENAGSWIWSHLILLINFPIKLWWILATIAAVILTLKVLLEREAKKSPVEPPYFEYTKDTFDKWIWKWSWRNTGSGFDINDLHPCCPECETPLMKNRGGYHAVSTMECPRGCAPIRGSRGWDAYAEDQNKVDVLIRDNVNKKYFNK